MSSVAWLGIQDTRYPKIKGLKWGKGNLMIFSYTQLTQI